MSNNIQYFLRYEITTTYCTIIHKTVIFAMQIL